MVPRQLALCSHRARAVAVVLGRHLAWGAARVVRRARLRLVFHEWLGAAFLYSMWVHSDGESSREGPDVEGPDVDGAISLWRRPGGLTPIIVGRE